MIAPILTEQQQSAVREILINPEVRARDADTRIGMVFNVVFSERVSTGWNYENIVTTTKILMEIAVVDAAVNDSTYDVEAWNKRYKDAVRTREYGIHQETINTTTSPPSVTTQIVPKNKSSWFWWVVIPTATVGAALAGVGIYMAAKDR